MIEGLSLCSLDKEGRDSFFWDGEDGSLEGVSLGRVLTQDTRAVRLVSPRSSAIRMASIFVVIFILAYSPFCSLRGSIFDF